MTKAEARDGDALGLEMPDRLSSSEPLQDFYALVSPVGRNNGGDWAYRSLPRPDDRKDERGFAAASRPPSLVNGIPLIGRFPPAAVADV